jgi:HEAT repeat protein
MIELRECIDKLSGDDEADRIYAAEDIGYANGAEGVPPLLARLPAEPSRAVREAIFAALQQIEADAVIEGCLALLDSQDSFLRNQAVEILRARGAAVIPFLERAFESGNNDRRKFVVDVLGKLGDEGTSGIYDRALTDADLNVVITAIESLGARRKEAFRARIENLIMPETHPMLLCASIEALAQIGDSDTVAIIRSRLGKITATPGYLQASYLKLLGAKGGPQDVDDVASLISGEGLEEYVLNALTALRTRFRDLNLPAGLAVPLQKIASGAENPLLAYQAVRLMVCLLQLEEISEFLNQCLVHPEKAVRIAAVQALRESGSKGTEDILRERLARETDEEVLQALTS